MLRVAELLEPLKSGGSLPWLGSGDDDRRYVVKFAGAGHGRAALLAELVVNRLARLWGLRAPAVTPIWLDAGFAHVGTDEFWDVLDRSVGWNLAVDYVAGSFDLPSHAAEQLPREIVRDVVWVDVLFANYDRSQGSVNLLRDDGDHTWLIDHGACRFIARRSTHPGVFELAPGHLFGGMHPKLHLLGFTPPGASRQELEEALRELPQAWLDNSQLTSGALISILQSRIGAFQLWVR